MLSTDTDTSNLKFGTFSVISVPEGKEHLKGPLSGF